MAAPVTESRERGGAKPLGPTLSEERILESYGFLESIFDFLKFYLIFIILVFLKKFFSSNKVINEKVTRAVSTEQEAFSLFLSEGFA